MIAIAGLRGGAPRLQPTPKDTIYREGTARLYRFRSSHSGEGPPDVRPGNRTSSRAPSRTPVLLIPSMINRWYILDLRHRASVAESLVEAGFDTWCLDWGVPEEEDRYLTWEDVLARLRRAVRRLRRETGAPKAALLGYCMGGTLAGIHAALHPDEVAALVNLLGPFDFSRGGFLRDISDPRWFDAGVVAAGGNVPARQMQSAFVLMRPTAQLGKWISYAERGLDRQAREAFLALETWAGDNVPFPAAAYETYIRELYQENRLLSGDHYVGGRRVSLRAVRCPIFTVAAEKDTICPPAAATALNDSSGSDDAEVRVVPGGHVGAVVGGKARTDLYPALTSWLRRRLWPARSSSDS